MSLTKDHFAVDPALNVPFEGGPGTDLDRSRLRLLKKELAFNPSASYITSAVKEFIPGMKPCLSKIPRNSYLIVVPTSTGYNALPVDIAYHLRQERKDLRIVNAKYDIIRVAHRTESKIKRNYAVRTVDPRQFEFKESSTKRLDQRSNLMFIVDDSISTGESAYVLQRQLSKRGVYVQGIVAAVCRGKKYTYPSDMLRIYNKITANHSTGCTTRCRLARVFNSL